MKLVPVWDIATRLFHWLLVLFVLVCFVSGDDEGLAFAVHAYAGYAVLVLVVFRLAWGVAGSPRSRFSDFVHGWPAVRDYGLSLLRFRPRHFVGHNPLGGWMILAMLAVLALSGASGVAMVAGGARWLEGVHEALGSFMQILVAIHIAGVLVDQFLVGQRIVQAMVWGGKMLDDETAAREAPLAPPLRALVVAALVLAAGAYFFRSVDYSGEVSRFAAGQKGSGGGHRD